MVLNPDPTHYDYVELSHCARIRTVPGLTCDRKVVRNDIRLAAKIITNLDSKWGLWPNHKKDDVLGRFTTYGNLKKNNKLFSVL
jgi:hypothetical protein